VCDETNSDDHAKRTKSRRLKRSAIGILILVVAAPVGYRAYEFLSTPDVGEPFDVEAFASYSLPDERNAFAYYRKALKLFVTEQAVMDSDATIKSSDFWKSWTAAEEGWEHAIPGVRRWVAVNRPMLAEWQRGADCAESLEYSPADLMAGVPWSSDSAQRLQNCARLQDLEGMRLIAEGHPTEAWGCFRNLLRASRHLAMHGTCLDTLLGNVIGELGVRGGMKWSAQKTVSAAQLKNAIRDLLAVEELRTPPSDKIKLDYVFFKLAENGHPYGASGRSWIRSTGYPAELGRSARLVVANLLTQVDRPRYLRTPVHPGHFGLFELDPKESPNPNLRPPEEIERFAETSAGTVAKMLRRIAPDAANEIQLYDSQLAMGGLQKAYEAQDMAQARRESLLLALALQLHFREYGEFPASLDELVKRGYLKSIPPDPFGRGEPFRYRRESAPSGGAVVWSIWIDGVDQGGVEKVDWVVSVKPPSTGVAPTK
jgi:hypothetical protein